MMGDHLVISGALLNPLKCFAGAAARQVLQVGQAPSGPTVIRPCTWLRSTEDDGVDVSSLDEENSV